MDRKIYTKTGDQGNTSLLGGSRVPKFHLRIEAYGTLDELNSFVGYLRDQLEDENLRNILAEVQDRLFTAESVLAADPEIEISRQLPQLQEQDIHLLESEIDRMNESLPPIRSFILPGGHPLVSLAHICRTVCRRAERITIRLSTESPVNPEVIRYLNRLSDYFFVLARLLSSQFRSEEHSWKPRI